MKNKLKVLDHKYIFFLIANVIIHTDMKGDYLYEFDLSIVNEKTDIIKSYLDIYGKDIITLQSYRWCVISGNIEHVKLLNEIIKDDVPLYVIKSNCIKWTIRRGNKKMLIFLMSMLHNNITCNEAITRDDIDFIIHHETKIKMFPYLYHEFSNNITCDDTISRYIIENPIEYISQINKLQYNSFYWKCYKKIFT